jgi:multiple sugar transport system permease protein
MVGFLLSKLHIVGNSTAWLASPGLALIGISVLVIWAASGLTMIILMAGMMGIPEDLYQAAAVDGAGRWAREWRITLSIVPSDSATDWPRLMASR